MLREGYDMERNLFRIIIAGVLASIFIVYYTISIHPLRNINSIDLKGKNDFWNTFINIHKNYDCVLMITPATDLFELPLEINVEVYVKDRCIYTDNLELIKDSNFKKFGTYKARFPTSSYLERNHENIYVVVSHNDNINKIILKNITYSYNKQTSYLQLKPRTTCSMVEAYYYTLLHLAISQ